MSIGHQIDIDAGANPMLWALNRLRTDGLMFNGLSWGVGPSLVVNVASECGYTNSHYRDLSHLSQMPGVKGNLNILLFPCNQFGQQEPGTNSEIEAFITNKYPGDFHIFAKIDVTGPEIDPAFEFLTEYSQKTPTWNFWKYLVDHNGHVIDAWGPQTSVEDLHQYIIAVIEMASKDEL